MKLSISNIAWEAEQDEAVYAMMRKYRYTGLEIAPTRLFAERPYEMTGKAAEWSKCLKKQYGFSVPSMQSVWYGRKENLFVSESERIVLDGYTRQAVDFACAVGCRNLVFGCPQNRQLPEGADPLSAVSFFRELGDYAAAHGVVIGMEANPVIYNTNYINNTEEALELIGQTGSEGFRLNLDTGTMIYNQEDLQILEGKGNLISHVHISEPGLKPVRKRKLHEDLACLLRAEGYQGYVSVEMSVSDSLSVLKNSMRYVREVFADE